MKNGLEEKRKGNEKYNLIILKKKNKGWRTFEYSFTPIQI